MGSLTFVFAGNFRQTFPVIPKGTTADIVKSCLKLSSIWRTVSTLHLRMNMRIHVGIRNTEFPLYLLSVGNGIILNNRGIVFVDL